MERVEVKDIRLPYELRRALAAEAEAAREAGAKVVAASGELSVRRVLLKRATNGFLRNLKKRGSSHVLSETIPTRILFHLIIRLQSVRQ